METKETSKMQKEAIVMMRTAPALLELWEVVGSGDKPSGGTQQLPRITVVLGCFRRVRAPLYFISESRSLLGMTQVV